MIVERRWGKSDKKVSKLKLMMEAVAASGPQLTVLTVLVSKFQAT